MLHEAKIAYYDFDVAILFVTAIGPAVAKATWRHCLSHFIDRVAARTCCAVNVLASRISFLFSWPRWIGSVFKHNMLKKFLNLKGLFRFPLRNLSEIFLILTRTERDVIKNIKLSSCTVPIFLSYFTGTRIFSTDFHKNPQISNLMTICPVAAELLHVDRRTDMKLIIAFRNFAYAPIIQACSIARQLTCKQLFVVRINQMQSNIRKHSLVSIHSFLISSVVYNPCFTCRYTTGYIQSFICLFFFLVCDSTILLVLYFGHGYRVWSVFDCSCSMR